MKAECLPLLFSLGIHWKDLKGPSPGAADIILPVDLIKTEPKFISMLSFNLSGLYEREAFWWAFHRFRVLKLEPSQSFK